MSALRIAIRLPLVVLMFLYGSLIAMAFMLGRDPRASYARHQGLVRHWMRLACRCIGVEVEFTGEPKPGPVLMVSNHVSWLDIAVLGAALPPRFLSKAEVRSWPVIGWLSQCVGTLYIRRGSRGGANSAGEAIGYALEHEARVLVFPEGTTSDGRSVRRFHPRLFQAAIDAGAPVQSVMLFYGDERGVNTRVAWIDNDSFVVSLLRVMGERRVHALVHFGLAYSTTGGIDRQTLAQRTEDEVRAFVEQRSGGSGRIDEAA